MAAAKSLTFGDVRPKLRGIFQRLCKSQRWNLAMLVSVRTCALIFYRSKDLPLRLCALYVLPDGGIILKLDQNMIKAKLIRTAAQKLRKEWGAKQHRVDSEIKEQINAWIAKWAEAQE